MTYLYPYPFRFAALVITTVLFWSQNAPSQNADTIPLANGGFEEGGDKPKAWTTEGNVTPDTVDPFEGKTSLKLQVDSLKLIPTQAMSEPFALSGKKLEVSGATRSNLYFQDLSFNGTLLVQFLDAQGKELGRQSVLSVHDKTPWKAFRKQVDILPDAVQGRLLAEFQKTHGDFWIDGLTVKSIAGTDGPACVTRFSTAHLGNLFFPGDKVRVDIQVEPSVPLNAKARVVICTLTDYWGALQHEPIRLELKEENPKKYTATLDLSQIPLKVGKYYEVHTEQDLGGVEPYRATASFAILPEAVTKNYPVEEIPFGTHTWDARLTEYFYLSGRLGTRRALVFWNWPDKPPYTPKFEGWEYDVRLGHPKKAGMRPYGIVYPVVDMEHDEHFRSDEDLRAGMRQSIELFKKDGLWGFQIGNEPPSWDPEKVKRNVELYRVVYEEAKKTDPEMFIIGSAIGPNEDYFKLGFGKYCDAYNVHCYGSLADMRRLMQEYKTLIAKYGNPKPIYSTEIGSKSQGLSRHEIAMDVVRKAVCFLADGGEFFTWFAVTYPDPKGTRRGTYGDSMDLFSGYLNMYNPRIDAVAYYHIINTMADKKFVSEKEYPDGTSAFLFRNGKGECLQVLWNMGSTADVFVPLKDVKAVRLVHVDGSEQQLEAGGLGVTLRVSEEPQLLVYQDPQGALPDKLGQPAIQLQGLPGTVVQGAKAQLVAQIEAGRTGDVVFSGPPGWKVSQLPEKQGPDGARLIPLEIEVPADTTAREAVCSVLLQEKGKLPVGELNFRLPIASSIQAAVVPLPANAAKGEGRVQLTVSNRGTETQVINWDVEIANEIPMTGGTFDFGPASPIQAHFTDLTEGSVTLKAGEEKQLILRLAQVDRLGIYRIRARARDATGRSVIAQRLISGFVGVPKIDGPLTVDGNLNEPDWKNAPVQEINDLRQFFKAEKEGDWTGPEDLSGKLRFLWDEKFLYVGVEVTDDTFSNPKKDDGLWAQDGLQFLIDPARDRREKRGRYDISVGLGQKGPQAWCHLSGDIRAPEGEIKEFQIGIKRGDKGNATYEVAIPWSRIPPFEPAPGRDLGLSMILNEDDGNSRGGFLGWFGGVHLKEMDHVADLILEGPTK